MNQRMKQTIDHCDECRSSRVRAEVVPELPCPKCKPVEHYAALHAFISSQCQPPRELILFSTPADRLQEIYTLVDDEGTLYEWRVGYSFDETNIRRFESIVEANMKLRDENKEVLAENARLRRDLERKK